jgi:hypothetical protein
VSAAAAVINSMISGGELSATAAARTKQAIVADMDTILTTSADHQNQHGLAFVAVLSADLYLLRAPVLAAIPDHRLCWWLFRRKQGKAAFFSGLSLALDHLTLLALPLSHGTVLGFMGRWLYIGLQP